MLRAAGSPSGKPAEAQPLDDLVADQVALVVAGDRERRVARDQDPPLACRTRSAPSWGSRSSPRAARRRSRSRSASSPAAGGARCARCCSRDRRSADRGRRARTHRSERVRRPPIKTPLGRMPNTWACREQSDHGMDSRDLGHLSARGVGMDAVSPGPSSLQPPSPCSRRSAAPSFAATSPSLEHAPRCGRPRRPDRGHRHPARPGGRRATTTGRPQALLRALRAHRRARPSADVADDVDAPGDALLAGQRGRLLRHPRRDPRRRRPTRTSRTVDPDRPVRDRRRRATPP